MRSKQAFERHMLWEKVSELQSNSALGELDPETRSYLKVLLEYLMRRKEQTNPYFVSEQSLDRLDDCLIYISRNIPNSPNTVAKYIDEAFNELASSWPAMTGARVTEISTATFEAIMSDMSQQIGRAHDAVNVVEKTKESFAVEIEKLEAEINRYRDATSEKMDEIASNAKEAAQELNSALKHNIEEANARAIESRDNTEAQYISSLSSIEAQAQDLLERVSNKASKISGKVIADNYRTYARNKAISKFVYDSLAVVFAVTGIFLVGYALVQLHADETSATVFKMAVSVASFTISGFLFKRGTYEQREAKTAKRTELTLRQYEAFIANLEDGDKDIITKQIAERVFIKGEIDGDSPTLSEAIAQRGISEKDVKVFAELLRVVKSTSE